MSYNPTNWATGDIVTAEKLNKLEEGVENASESSLPAVTSDDNGDVLTVVEGEWAKAAPSAGTPLFTVTLTAGESDSYTVNKSIEEIYNAFSSGKIVQLVYTNSYGDISIYPLCQVFYEADSPDNFATFWYSLVSLSGDSVTSYVVEITVGEGGEEVSFVTRIMS